MATPLVSVLMSAYNAAATLEATLQSLQAQTLDDFEVVAVDDGSADATRKILETWQKNFPPLRLIAAEHRGLIPALNQGLGLCRGRFVARMDADDLAHPQRLENQVSDRYTVIDTEVQDDVGLLYKITHALGELELDIHMAIVNTVANRAIDAFYVVNSQGEKIVNYEVLEQIRERLLADLGGIA